MKNEIGCLMDGTLTGTSLKEFVAQSFITDYYSDEKELKLVTLEQYRQGGPGIFPRMLREKVGDIPVMRTQIEKIRSWSTQECLEMAQIAYEHGKSQYQKDELTRKQMLARFEAILPKLQAWKPDMPDSGDTEILERLREGAIGAVGYQVAVHGERKSMEPVPLSGEEWREETIAKLQANIARAELMVMNWEKNRVNNLAFIDSIPDGE